MEMRAFFGFDTRNHTIETDIQITPNRSPFMKERIDVLFEGNDLQEIVDQVTSLPASDTTFKVVSVKNPDAEKISFAKGREIEREIGLKLNGTADLHDPEKLYGVIHKDNRWVFGDLYYHEPIWTRHQKKPYAYSTALSSRIARAVANIAVPNPDGIKAVDPCCGIGTVLLEACSMGIDVKGSDINPKVVYGSRKNLAYFGYEADVALKNIQEVEEAFDVAIIDMPYNLCSVLSARDQLAMLKSARRFAEKVVIVTIEPIDDAITKAGLSIVDRSAFRKNGAFTREVLLCE
ncbi:TRM11 family SAM-dependent methyltransferase [Alteribacter populi]|uniref:TRM11 family SAM-dependent methyltransferase n=1 Tax=Alteribacter populi TaxID=2011011 RepID=UPI000BBA7161|nr:RNA methyltransferase [Alteribacter populi]